MPFVRRKPRSSRTGFRDKLVGRPVQSLKRRTGLPEIRSLVAYTSPQTRPGRRQGRARSRLDPEIDGGGEQSSPQVPAEARTKSSVIHTVTAGEQFHH
jgi:hypothetical protein